jgi:arginase family enzyme
VDRPVSATVAALRCPTADTSAEPARGAEAIAVAVAARVGVPPDLAGEAGEPRPGRYDAVLRDAGGCLRHAGRLVEESLAAGRPLVLAAGDCSVAVGTLAALGRRRPDAAILWLDAHGDFNTPDTSGSGYLGGMCLAGACGLWDTGLDGTVEPARVVLAGIRDLDPGERDLLDGSPATVLDASPQAAGRIADALGDAPVFVHLDVDVLDPEVFADTPVPVAGGWSEQQLADALAAAGDGREVLGIEITAFAAPNDDAERDRQAAIAATAVEALLRTEN